MIAQIPTRLKQWGATPDYWLSAAALETVETVCDRVAYLMEIQPEALFARTRVRIVVEARQLAMAVLRVHGLTLESIGHIFVNRDHGTVINACARVASRRRTDRSLDFVFRYLASPGNLSAPNH